MRNSKGNSTILQELLDYGRTDELQVLFTCLVAALCVPSSKTSRNSEQLEPSLTYHKPRN